LSIEERYPDQAKYVDAVSQAASDLRRQRLLLEEDVRRYVDAAASRRVGK